MEASTNNKIYRPIGPVLLGLIFLCLGASPSQAREVAGKVQFVVGNVSAISTDGSVRRLSKGDRIYSGDTVKSGSEGSAQLIYRDRSRMAVRVNTEFKIKEYRFNEKDKKGAVSVFSLLSGALRTVSGLIGSINPQKVTVDTPLATIGIRGTDHEVVHIVQQRSGAKAIANPGTYNKVYKGATVIRTSRGNLNLGLNQVGYVGGSLDKIVKPVKLKDLPSAIKTQLINKIPVQAKTLPGTDGKRKTAVNKANAGQTGAVAGPDVSKTPSPGGPVPVPYPSTSGSISTVGEKLAPSTLDPSLTTTISPTKTLDPSLTTTISPDLTRSLSTTTTISPTKTLDPSVTTTISPDLTRSLSTTTTISPTTTTIAPKITAPTTTTISPTTTTKSLSTTTTISPTQTLKSTTTTITSPTTTIKK